MSQQVAVNEPVLVEAQMRASGEMVVKAFDWQGTRHYVAAHGRRWDEWTNGRRFRCLLVQTSDFNSFELRWDPAEDEWMLHQAWLSNLV